MENKNFSKKLFGYFAALAFCAFPSLEANAVDGVSVEAGNGSGVDMARVGAQWKWQKRWLEGAEYHVGGYWDAQVGYWNGASDIADISLTPTFRLQRNQGYGAYLEGAIGFHYISSKNVTSTKQPGSNFEFGDHVGVGYRFGDKGRYDMQLRFQHLSNAGIKHPNPAINFTQVRFQYWF